MSHTNFFFLLVEPLQLYMIIRVNFDLVYDNKSGTKEGFEFFFELILIFHGKTPSTSGADVGKKFEFCDGSAVASVVFLYSSFSPVVLLLLTSRTFLTIS